MFSSNFLTPEEIEGLAREHATPLFVYSKARLEAQAKTLNSIAAPYGFTPRYAMKANPNADVLAVLREQGINIDASSGYEAQLALDNGFEASQILLTSQQLAHNLPQLVEAGVQFNATSLRQLEAYGSQFPGTSVSVRLNPGIGSGHSAKTNVGGPASSFGIWHEYIPKIHDLCERYKLTIVRVHTHIGSGTDPRVWQEAARASLELVKEFTDASIVNLGGGFKVARLDDEHGTDVAEVGNIMAVELQKFYEETGRKLHLELEPGTFLVANAGVLIASVEDLVDTGPEGYNFLKLNTGMNDILRPTLYRAQHPIAVVSNVAEQQAYVVVGHNCESGDLLTPMPGQGDVLGPRELNKAQIADLVIIGGTGAYCASMAVHGYNSYPKTPEILV